MNPPRLRLAFAALTAAVLALSACAVPGQPGNPGVAGILGDHEVTNQQLDQINQAWLDETYGEDVPTSRRHILTVELMRPQLMEAMTELGYEIDGEAAATQWLSFARSRGMQADRETAEQITPLEPSPELVHSVESYLALAVLSWTQPDQSILRAIAEDVENNAVLSPRSGEFSAEQFLAELLRAESAVLSQQLEIVFYTEFQHVTGFSEAERDWLDRG